MRIYYYHHIDARTIHAQWLAGEKPSHLLYGACHLPEHGIEVIYHRPRFTRHRLLLSLHTMIKILANYRKFDAVYATAFRGLELIVFLRALKLFRKPIICWHHQPIVKASNPLREVAARLFYKGFDELVFFSKAIVNESLKSVKAPRDHMHVVHWGADLDFYDNLKARNKTGQNLRYSFISTGRELRDMQTLVSAFNETPYPLDIFINREHNGFSYEAMFHDMKVNGNIHIHYVDGDITKDLAVNVYHSKCAVICCKKANYTVGLTTVVEALALGIPMICTHNPWMPLDIEKEGCGLTVGYHDVEGWTKAANYLAKHPQEAKQFGYAGRKLAEEEFNDLKCAEEVAAIISSKLR